MSALSPALLRKRDELLRLISQCRRVAVAFSAGVDSTVVAKAAFLACGNEAVAVTAESPSLASGELDEARRLAALIGIRHFVLRTQELADDRYRRNAPDRCFFCKSELYDRMLELRDQLGFDVILNGANVDDQGDYRPGMQAAQIRRVRSPLLEAGITKHEVRELARSWDLPVWDKPASPCLSSRVAYGIEVTPERLQRIDQAERYLREKLGLRELRVRLEANDLARIEVPVEVLDRLVEPALRQDITSRLHQLGFRYVTLDLEGFRSGSLNAVLPVESLRVL